MSDSNCDGFAKVQFPFFLGANGGRKPLYRRNVRAAEETCTDNRPQGKSLHCVLAKLSGHEKKVNVRAPR